MARNIAEVTPTTIEQRLAGWVAIRERQGVGAGARSRPTITLSREFGCEAFAVATCLEQMLVEATGEEWAVFDRALIDRVANDTEIAPRILKRLGDMPREFEALGFHPEGIPLTQDAVYHKLVRCLIPLAQAGNAIIIGRGGAVLCQSLANCFHFRLVASLDWRVHAYARRMDMPLDEARRTVMDLSAMRAAFLAHNLGTSAEDPKYYDAIFSNERLTTDGIARAIVAHVKGAWSDRHLFRT